MTDRIHVEDLTQNHTPFGLLDDDTQARLKDWPHGIEVLTAVLEWSHRTSVYYPSLTYRAIPAPIEKPSVDWSQVGPAVNHIAADDDGGVFGYELKPRHGSVVWVQDDGRIISQVDLLFPSYRRGSVPWDQSLISRPGVEK